MGTKGSSIKQARIGNRSLPSKPRKAGSNTDLILQRKLNGQVLVDRVDEYKKSVAIRDSQNRQIPPALRSITKEYRIGKGVKSKKMTGAKHIPSSIRNNPFSDLPLLREKDLEEGVLNLVHQGFIPKDVDVMPVLNRNNPILISNPLDPEMINIQDAIHQRHNIMNSFVTDINRELDMNSKDQSREVVAYKETEESLSNFMTQPEVLNIQRSTIKSRLIVSASTTAQVNPEDIVKQLNRQLLAVENGKVKETTPEFFKFKSQNYYIWGDVVEVLKKMEDVFDHYGLTNVKIFQDKIILFAQYMREPSRLELVTAIENSAMILEYAKKRQKEEISDEKILESAAIKIQRILRKWIARRYFTYLIQANSKVMLLQQKIRIWYKYKMTKLLIAKIKEKQYQEYILMHKEMAENWNVIQERKRVEVHFNSLGYDRFQRNTVANYRFVQNSQLSRIFRLIDPLVEIIYISPFTIPQGTLRYYIDMLDAIGVPNISERLRIVVPENWEFFSHNNMNLSDILYYSPRAIEKVTRMIGKKNAFIVGGFPGIDDIRLSLKLGIPFMTGNPIINKRFSEKYRFKTLLVANDVPCLEFSPMISSKEQFCEYLVSLIISNPQYEKWEYNVNEEVKGRGAAELKIESVSLINEIRLALPEGKKNFVHPLTDIMKRFLPTNLNTAVSKVYRNYSEYRECIYTLGGIIEAIPIGEHYTVGILSQLDPSGRFTYMSSFEVIKSQFGHEMGYLCPQSLVPDKVARKIGKRVCKLLHEVGVNGYITTHVSIGTKDKRNMKIAVKSVEPYYTDFQNSFEMIRVLERFEDHGEFISNQEYEKREKRTFFVFPKIDSINFPSEMGYKEFYEKCRVQGICYDIFKKSGIIFLTSSDLSVGSLGMIIIGKISFIKSRFKPCSNC